MTVLFCDVTGSTAMGERLDPESTRRVMSPLLRGDARGDRAPRRHGREVHRRRGHGGVRRPGRARGRRAARRACGRRHARGARRAQRGARAGLGRPDREPDRRQHGRGRRRRRRLARSRRRRQRRRPAWSKARRRARRCSARRRYRLVRDAVEAEPVEPLDAKGKSEPLTAFRLDGLVEGAEFITRRLDSPLVGRENELAQLQRAFDHAVSERVAYQFTLLGAAGIGKSRLVRELNDRVDATLLSGRCLPYGEGITYWPLAEIEQLAGEIDFDANRDEIALQTRRILERLAREQAARRRLRRPPVGASRRSSTSSTTSPISRETRRCCCSALPGPTCSTTGPAGAAGS